MSQVVAHLQTEIGLAMQADDVFHCAQDPSCLQVWTTADALVGKNIRITQVLGSWNMSEVGVGNVCHVNSEKDAVFCHLPLDAYKSGLSWLAMGVPDDSPLQQPLPVGVRCHDTGPSSADAPCHLLSGNEFMVAKTEHINMSKVSAGSVLDSAEHPAIVSLGWKPAPSPPDYHSEMFISDPDEVLCFDVAGGDGYNGALLQLWDCYSGENQWWRTAIDLSEGGHLSFKGDGTDRGCIDVPDGNFAEGQTVWIWECSDDAPQWWDMDNDQTDGPRVGNLQNSGWCLERPEDASAGDVPFLMPCSDSFAQQWRVYGSLSRQGLVSV